MKPSLLVHRAPALCVVVSFVFSFVAAIASAKPLPQAVQQPSASAEDKAALLRARQAWFQQRHATSSGESPAAARLRALRRRQEMTAAPSGQALSPRLAPGAQGPSAPAAWNLLGPQPVDTGSPNYAFSGRVTALAVDRTDSNIVYLGAAEGGVWKSTDGGANWAPKSDFEESVAIGSLAIDPNSCTPGPCKIIYAGTGEANLSGDEYAGAGVLKSTDAGETWTLLGSGTFASIGAHIGAIAVSPSNPQIILAATLAFGGAANSGLYRSTDGGNTWFAAPVSGVSTGFMTDVLFDPANGNVAYAAIHNHYSFHTGGPVFKSIDAGATWSQADAAGTSTLPTGIGVGRVALAIAPSDTSILFALIDDESAGPNPGSLLGIFRSTDAGKNWTQITNPTTPSQFCGGQCWYDLDLRVSPADPATLFAGGYFAYRSTDSGNTWQYMSGASGTNLHSDSHALAFSNPAAGPLKLYFGNDGGAWRSDNPTAAIGSYGLTNLNATLAITQFYPGLSVHPSNENFGFGGTQDNGTLSYSGGLPWREVGGGDGGQTIIDQQMPSVVYISCQYFCLARSNSSGQPGTFIGLPLTGVSDGLNPFLIPYIGDPNKTGRIYAALMHVFQSNDYGDSWTEISPELDSDRITAVAVAPGNSDVVYAVTSQRRVWRTVNSTAGATSTWSDLTTSNLPSGGNRQFTQVAINPFDPNTAIVTLSGFGASHVFLTANGGISWANISGTGVGALPDIPVNDVVFDPDPSLAANTFYVGTDIGVFWTSDGGNTWAPLGTGLPNAAVLSLAVRKQSRLLRAGTHGRSVWALQLPAASPADFTISLATASQISLAGGTATYTVSLAASHGFSQPVTLTCASTPAVGCSPPPPVTPSASGTSATITVTVPAGLAPSTNPYSLTITGTSGSLSHAVQAQLLVATLSAAITPSASTIPVGSSSNFAVSLTATDNFTGPVSFNCAGLAAGLRCVYPAPATVPGSATLSVFVDSKPAISSVPHGPAHFWPGSTVWQIALATLLLLLATTFAIGRRNAERTAPLVQLAPGLFPAMGLILLLALAVGFTSCGGATSGSSSGNNGTSLTSSAGGTTGGASGSGGTSGSGGSDGSSGGTGGSGGIGGGGGTGGTGGDGSSVTTQFMVQAQSGGATVSLGTVSVIVP